MVLKDVFDHSSIAATILRRFCSPQPPFMSQRVSAARDLRAALPLDQPRAARDLGLASLPSVAEMRQRVDERALRAPRNPDD
jgi:hypothetical protein